MYGNEVFIENIGLLSNKPKSLLELENIIKCIDKLRVCERSVLINKYKIIESKFGSEFIQSYDRWRHTYCSIILDNVTER